jgi:hypothetical protein
MNANLLAELPKEPSVCHQNGNHRHVKPVARSFGTTVPYPVAISIGHSSAQSEISQAMYGTGEHVLAGENQTMLGGRTDLKVNGIAFSYAELIAMGDLYDTFDDMIKAPPAELKRLQTLIQKSKQYYAAKVARSTPVAVNPSDADWQNATNKRYGKLAEENFAHFAPSNATLTPGFTNTGKNNKAEWERYHRQAIDHVRKGVNSLDLADALVINAFGDHFLTDAFASGHQFNKEDVSKFFQSKMLSGGKLNSAGKTFFEKVSKLSFQGDVKKTFSGYETVEKWNGIFHPNIDSEERFALLLGGIMEKQPGLLGKTVVALAVHDSLNGTGVDVKNAKGKTWRLTGDSHLDQANLAIMREAVGQSIANVYDAVNSGTPHADFFKKVWDYVPQPTPSGVSAIQAAIQNFTNPAGATLIMKTVNMIKTHYRDILDELVQRNFLKKA